ncbi:MAG: decaprenyl-phosphate phosphoribosyltransferase [Cyclobacteriaceae bacterium]|nr:decaprenyl-phosphate phosphoribosyltransferase [Cyclobacteriaceae bacterium]
MRYLFLLRIHHWPKNLFVFIPAFFAGVMRDGAVFISLVQGFTCFSLISSVVYIINDYRDREKDRQHPVKKNRPLASGAVSTRSALLLLSILLVVALPWSFWLNPFFGFSIATYLVLNVLYSAGLKNISILDTLIVSSGFLLRTLAGGWLAQVTISQWLVIMVFLLSFFLAIAKRRDDLILFQSGQAPMRASSRHYTIEFINIILSVLAGVIIVSYLMYTISEEVVHRLQTPYLYITGLFVFAGLIRFLQITIVENRSGSPTKIFLTDVFIQVTIALWVACFFLVIYV